MTSVIYCGDTWTPTQLQAKLKNGPNVCALISSPSLSSGFLSSLPPTPQEESLTYQGLLDKLQADILKARDESFNIQLKVQEAEFARDQAKVSYGRRLCNKSTLHNVHAGDVKGMIYSALLPSLIIRVKLVMGRVALNPLACEHKYIHLPYQRQLRKQLRFS